MSTVTKGMSSSITSKRQKFPPSPAEKCFQATNVISGSATSQRHKYSNFYPLLHPKKECH